MSWDDVKVKSPKQVSEQREKQAAIAKHYHACFASDSGKAVLDHLVQNFIMSNDTDINSPNIEYVSGYHAGEAGIVKMILNQMKRAQEL